MKILCFFLWITNFLFAEKISFWKAIEIIKKENPELVAKKFEIDKSRADIITAKIKPNPIFNNQTLIQKNGKESGGAFNSGNRQDWFQVTQVIPVANQIENSVELARRNVELAKNNYLEQERNIIFIVLSKWLEAWYYREKIKSYKLAKEFLDELINSGDKKNKDKTYVEIELKRTKILSEQFSIIINTLDTYAENSEESLTFYLNRNNSLEIDDSNYFKYEIEKKNISEYSKIAISKRSDSVLANSSKYSAISKLKLEESNAYPRPELGVIYNPQNNDKYYGTFVTIPIPINNRNQGNITKAKIDLEQAISEIDLKEKSIKVEVKNSLKEYIIFQENYLKYKNLAYQADEIRNKIEDSYLKGKTSYVDYLEAQNDWFELRIAQLESYYSFKKSYLQFLFVTGLVQELK